MSFIATILSEEEIAKLPQNEKPLSHRISSELYHKIFDSIGAASMAWNPRPSNEVFDSELATEIAVELCLFVADEIEKVKV